MVFDILRPSYWFNLLGNRYQRTSLLLKFHQSFISYYIDKLENIQVSFALLVLAFRKELR